MKLVLGFVASLLAIVLIKNIVLAIIGSWVMIVLVIAALIGVAMVGAIGKAFIVSNREGRKLAKQQRTEILARAVNQNTAYLQGHDRGLYGDFPPERLV